MHERLPFFLWPVLGKYLPPISIPYYFHFFSLSLFSFFFHRPSEQKGPSFIGTFLVRYGGRSDRQQQRKVLKAAVWLAGCTRIHLWRLFQISYLNQVTCKFEEKGCGLFMVDLYFVQQLFTWWFCTKNKDMAAIKINIRGINFQAIFAVRHV